MKRERRYWLFKSEPEDFSFDDLLAAKGKRTSWDGVRNYQARNLLRDEVGKGDGVLFYHSSSEVPAVVGLAEVVSAAHPDATALDPRAEHHDPKSRPDAPTWYAVDVRAVRALPRAVPLRELKANRRLARMAVVQRGQRLSVQPVSAAEWREVLRMGGIEPETLS